MTTTKRETLVLACLRQVTPMIRNFAWTHQFEYDDLYQDAAEIILRECDRLAQAKKPYGLATTLVRRQVLIVALRRRLVRAVPTLSLDVPFAAERGDLLSFADVLVEPVRHVNARVEKRKDTRVAALYAALRRLRLDEQQYIREGYGLYAYGPVPHCYRSEPERTRAVVCKSAYRHLRKDTQLAAAIVGGVAYRAEVHHAS